MVNEQLLYMRRPFETEVIDMVEKWWRQNVKMQWIDSSSEKIDQSCIFINLCILY